MELKIGENIKWLRKQRNLTQEALAEAIGVSIAAVSKWENDRAYPDLVLLGPLARILGTDTDELLGYQPDLTEDEVMALMAEGQELFESGKADEAIAYCEKTMQEYPQDLFLKFRAASLYMQYATAVPEEEFVQRQMKRATELFEASTASSNTEIREAALYVLAGLYQTDGREDDALRAIESLPKVDYDIKLMKAGILYQQGKEEEAEKLTQSSLYAELRDLGLNLRALAKSAMRRKEYDQALEYLEVSLQVDALFRLDQMWGRKSDYCMTKMMIWNAQGKKKETLDAMEEFAGEILRPGSRIPQNNPFFHRLEWFDNGASDEFVQKNMAMILMGPEFSDELKQDPRYQEILRRLEGKGLDMERGKK
jgi:transcriptional regulator with XRE-family HTH domain